MVEKNSEENFEKYFNKIGVTKIASKTLSLTKQVEYLKQLYFAHVKSFTYQNLQLRKISQQHPVVRERLNLFKFWQLLDNKGGYCYQIAQLLFTVLKELDFNVIRCSARVLNGLAVNSQELLALPATHMVLVVSIGEQKFFLDAGLGARGPRFPILISSDQQIFKLDMDQFKFYRKGDVYVLERLQGEDNWIQLIQTDLKELEDKALKKLLLKLERYPATIGIRDSKTLLGMVTDNGYKSFFWDVKSKEFIYSEENQGKYTKETLQNSQKAYEKIQQTFNIESISQLSIETYCSEKAWPKPKKSWEVAFPIDETELKTMAKNLQP